MKKISSKSAGRVQSVALKMIVDREREILSFKSEEYHSIHALFKKSNKEFEATLQKIDGKKAELKTNDECKKLISSLDTEFLISKMSDKRKAELNLTPVYEDGTKGSPMYSSTTVTSGGVVSLKADVVTKAV